MLLAFEVAQTKAEELLAVTHQRPRPCTIRLADVDGAIIQPPVWAACLPLAVSDPSPRAPTIKHAQHDAVMYNHDCHVCPCV